MWLFRFLRTVLNLIRKWRNAYIHGRVKQQLEGSTTFSYTSDWLSKHLGSWQRALKPLINQPNIRALEIGSFEGRSAVWLLEHVLTHPSSSLVCIDPFFGGAREARFDHNIALTKQAIQLEKRKGFSEDVLPELVRDTFDLIYIDGSHTASNVLLDAFLSWRLLKVGGVVIFDDYLWIKAPRASERPKLAIDLFLEQLKGHYKVLHFGYQVLLRKTS
jgi:hypothetical protein